MAGSLNKVMLIGRLGQDPKLNYLPSGQPVVNVNLATDENFKDKDGQRQEKTEWHRLVIYGRQAEMVSNYLSKGRLIFVEGSLRTRKWQKDGADHYTTEVVAQRVQFLDSRREGEQPDGGQRSYAGGQGGQRSYQGGQGGGQRQGGGRGQQGGQPWGPEPDDDLGPAFPSEAGGMDDVPF